MEAMRHLEWMGVRALKEKTLESRARLVLLLIVVILFLLWLPQLFPVKAQPQVEWNKTYGGKDTDVGYCVQQTSDGGYIIVGSTNCFGASGCDVYLIKTDSNGNMQWNKTYGGGRDDVGYCVQQTSDGGYIIVGSTKSFGSGLEDVYLIKTDAYGNMQWNKTYGGKDTDVGYCVQQTSDGGYIIVGTTKSFGSGSTDYVCLPFDAQGGDVYLIKTDAYGNMQWNKTYGGKDTDVGYCVQQTSDGGYIIVGTTNSFGASGYDVYLIKTDSNGNMQWNKTYGGGGYDVGLRVRQTSDGGYIIVGTTNSFVTSREDNYLTKTDAFYLIKTDAYGNMQWSEIYGDKESYKEGYCVQQTSDGGYIIVGGTLSFRTNSWDVYLIKLGGSGGVEKKVAPALSIQEPQVNGLTVTVNGNVAPGYSDASITRIHFDWGDGSQEDGSWPASHTYGKPGTYTVTVTAYQSDGLSTTKTLQVKVEASLSSVILLNFSVYYGEQFFTISVEVPLEKYNRAVQQMENIYTQYPGIDPSVLEKAYYLQLHANNPSDYPIVGVSILKDGQHIADKKIKAEVLAGLLTYCFELFPALSRDMLNAYHGWGDEWRKLYDDAGWGVRVSDLLAGTKDVINLVLIYLENKGAETRVKKAVSFTYDLFTFTYDELKAKYGTVTADYVYQYLLHHGLVSSPNYDPAEVYEKIVLEQSLGISDLVEFYDDVIKSLYGSGMSSNEKEFMTEFLNNLIIGGAGKEFTISTVASLFYYFKYFGEALSVVSPLKVGIKVAVENILTPEFWVFSIQTSIAHAILESYVFPMATTISTAWKSMKTISDAYYSIHIYGYKVAYPENNILNLTNSIIWACLVGGEYLNEYWYWELTYYYKSMEHNVPTSELNEYQRNAQIALWNAQSWRNALKRIHAISEADVSLSDPEGVNFSLEFLPPPSTSPFPVVPKNSSGFVLVANRTSSLTLSSGNYKFIVENRTWFSNFTYSLYVDDAYGNSYLIVFNPPQQQYSVEMENEAPVMLKNFALTNDGVKVSDAGKATGKHIVFNVVGFNVDPASVTVVPSQGKPSQATPPKPPFQLIFLSIASIVILALIGIYLRKRHAPPPLPPPPPPLMSKACTLASVAV
jgi:hypothetical protein